VCNIRLNSMCHVWQTYLNIILELPTLCAIGLLCKQWSYSWNNNSFFSVLFNDVFQYRDYIASDRMMTDDVLSSISKETVVAYSKCCPRIWLEGPRNSTEILSEGTRCPSRGSDRARPEYRQRYAYF
jgi:hypothetical protein